jgi:hypothetical protein
MNNPHSVQHVVPADTLDREKGVGSPERAVPAEGASLEAALYLLRTLKLSMIEANDPEWQDAANAEYYLRKIVAWKRSREAPGGNRVINEREGD